MTEKEPLLEDNLLKKREMGEEMDHEKIMNYAEELIQMISTNDEYENEKHLNLLTN